MGTYKKAVVDYYHEHPDASIGKVARALGCSKSTVVKYRPEEYKPKPLTEEEQAAFLEKWERGKLALAKLDWRQVKEIRNANDYRLWPMNWRSVELEFETEGKPIPGGFCSAEGFEADLKELCDALYDWHLYEPCPKCGKGIRVPRWRAGTAQWTPFCGCSEFPLCDFSADREGKPVGA